MRKKKLKENKDFEFARPLGEAVKLARSKSGFTQGYVSEKTDVDIRTILNIENGNGNPTLEKLYSLVRFYGIDPRPFFYPELAQDTSSREPLRLLLETCTEKEAEMITPIIRAILDALRTKDADDLQKIHNLEITVSKKSLLPDVRRAGSASCVWLFAQDHFHLNDVDSCFLFALWAV